MFKLKKTGRFAFDGVHVVDVQEGKKLTDDQWQQLLLSGWAVSAPTPVLTATATRVVEKADDPTVDWEFASELAADDDKEGLASYADGFGVKLKRNKTSENMLSDFHAAIGE